MPRPKGIEPGSANDELLKQIGYDQDSDFDLVSFEAELDARTQARLRAESTLGANPNTEEIID